MFLGLFKRTRDVLLGLSIVLVDFSPLIPAYLAAPVYASSSPLPQINSSIVGSNSTLNSPPSPTIAASPKEEIELLNTGYLIVKSSGKTKSGSIASLIDTNNTFVSDPQVIWDPSTSRFYFSIFENKGTSTPDEGIAWGFSKTATPTGPSDFCTYFNGFNYGSTSFPDKESLGDTSDFLLFSSNRYSISNGEMTGSDVAWVSKPPTGKTCPAAGSFSSGIQSLQNSDGTAPFTPASARQVDPSPTGYVIATPSYVSGDTLTEFSITKNETTGAAVIGAPSSITVPEYSYPPSAPQAGETMSGQPAPNLETRIYLSQVIMAYDPRVGQDVLWTAHTIAGGAGTEVRWYEINPANLSLDQYGTISDPNLYVFNGTISPDRIVDGKKQAFGNSAVINVNTSSASTYTAIQVASTINGQPTSPLLMVKQSTGPNVDFSCFEPNIDYCRWGDYSGATPDPGASTKGTYGEVWISNEWNTPDINDSTPVWQTQIANVQP